MDVETTIEALRSTTLFAGFTDEQLEMVPKVGRSREFAAGEKVVAVDDVANPGFWLIVEGVARVEVGGEFIRTIEAGDHFGELALLTGEPRSADVFAQTDLVALELTDRHLKGLLANDADVALAMIAELARRLRSLTHDYAEAIHDSSESVHGHVLGPIDVTTGID